MYFDWRCCLIYCLIDQIKSFYSLQTPHIQSLTGIHHLILINFFINSRCERQSLCKAIQLTRVTLTYCNLDQKFPSKFLLSQNWQKSHNNLFLIIQINFWVQTTDQLLDKDLELILLSSLESYTKNLSCFIFSSDKDGTSLRIEHGTDSLQQYPLMFLFFDRD